MGLSNFTFTGPGILALALLCACGKSGADLDRIAAGAGPEKGNGSPSAQLGSVAGLVKSGELDQAAARLMQLQAASASFNAKEAADYQTVSQEAYSRSLEAAQKGDAKAVKALQLLQVSRPH